ncbi:potassium transporter 5 [Canna indica]|uniref:Potassium transporter 5 n=1 Tax=Canna indica TaxID=4628 RepID=A0AAQ3KQE2_9LILI|nr:potassium transporter 5 [Canna indica]
MSTNKNNEKKLQKYPTQLRRHNLLDLEASIIDRHSNEKITGGWGSVTQLLFQSLGIVYRDIDTSPFYVFANTFANSIRNEDDVLSVLSLIFYTLTIIHLLKYVFVVLRATDNGTDESKYRSIVLAHICVVFSDLSTCEGGFVAESVSTTQTLTNVDLLHK